MPENLKVKALAEHLKGELAGDGEVELTGAASLDEASTCHLTFYDGKDPEILKRSDAGCVITGFQPDGFSARSVIVVDNVRLAWARALAFFLKPELEGAGKMTFVSPQSDIAPTAVILPFTFIGAGSTVGAGSRIGPNVTIHPGSYIGRNVIVGAGSVIGSAGFGYVADEDGNHIHIPHLGGVKIHDNVHIGAGVCIDRGTVSDTVIGEGTKIDNLVHIAHNVRIGKRCLITAQCGVAGSSTLADGVTLAGQSGISDHITVGESAVVLAKSAVFKNVAPGQMVSGIPARPHLKTLKAQARLYKDVKTEDDS